LIAFGIDDCPAVPLAFGAVGFVESATTRWLNDPAPMPLLQFTAQLSAWMWSLWDSTLQAGRVDLDPHQPIASQARQIPPSSRGPSRSKGLSGPG